MAVCVCAAASDGGLGPTSAEMTTRTTSAGRREPPLRLGGTSSSTQYWTTVEVLPTPAIADRSGKPISTVSSGLALLW